MTLHRSLAFKLSLSISGCCSLVLLVIFALNYQFSKKMIMDNVSENAHNLTLHTVSRIDAVVRSVQKIAENTSYVLESGSMNQQQLLAMLRAEAQKNDELYGESISFEPYAFNKNLFSCAPYYYKANGTLTLSMSTDYFLDDYYQMPKELNAPVWSEPYIDGDAGIMMATYSVPFYRMVDGKKIFWGVVAADISLEWLQKVVSSVQVLQTGDAFLLSRNGTIITHPNKDFIMNETLFSVAETRNDSTLRSIGREMIAGKSGFVRITSLARHKESWMCFAPIPSTGWSLGVIFPEDEFMADVRRSNTIIAILGMTAVLLLVVVVVLLSRSITRPLRAMAGAAEAIGTGHLDLELPVSAAKDEVGRLSDAFRHMQTSLKQYILDLKNTTAAHERIESELMIARQIQTGMLPRIFPPFPGRKDMDIFAIMDPAKEVGGDFYDFFLIGERKLCFLVGDVSGKGVPAALFMMINKVLLKNEGLSGTSPDQILFRVNNIISDDNDELMFVTIFCATIDLISGELEWANAGHNPPLIGSPECGFRYVTTDKNFVLGVRPNVKFALNKTTLKPGETFFLYTDGVTEAMNPESQLFSESRLRDSLNASKECCVPEMIQHVRTDITAFVRGADQSDDITMLALKYHGPGR